jgi:DNA-directed RNA polymerase specialized sigma24 family protein
VKLDQSSPVGRAGRFDTTRWSVVVLSAQSQAPGSQTALPELCTIYWYPLYAFIRRRGNQPNEAQDLTKGFFLDLLKHNALSRVDRGKGKFRSFLLASLEKYLSTEAARSRCFKRGGEMEFVSLDAASGEERYRLEPVDALTPEKIFDARWTMALLGEAMNRLGQQFAAQGKASTFETLKPFLDVANRQDLPSYEKAADNLGLGVGAVKSLIHRLRKQYTSLVREEISRTVSDYADIDGEIHELCEALIASEGWIMP